MKKLISSCSALAILAGFSSTFAGGIELPPPPADYFSGFTIGLVGSFWHNSWSGDGQGRIVCNNVIGQRYAYTRPAPEEYDWSGLFGTCITPVGDSYLDTAGVSYGMMLNMLNIPIIGTFSHDGDGIDKTGAIGGQLTYGKVFQGETMGYYLGIYGGGQWGNSSDSIDYSWDTKNLLSLFDLTAVGLLFRTINHSSLQEALKDSSLSFLNQPVHAEVNTHVEMENVYDVGAQLGLLLTPRTMGYLKVGAAWSEISARTNFRIDFPEIPLPGFDKQIWVNETIHLDQGIDARTVSSRVDLSGFATTSVEDTEIGYELGAGVSQAVTENLILSLEYVFRDFGRVTAGPGDIFVPEDLLHPLDRIGVVEKETNLDVGTITTTGSIQDPLFYQATRASAKVHQSAFNAVLAYHCNWLQ